VAAAHAALEAVDPAAAARIGPHNLRRVVRALEVVELTGRRFSDWDDTWQQYRSVYEDLDVAYLEPDTVTLRAAIDARAEAMVEGGLLDEAAALRRAPRSRTAMAAIGYAEAEAVLAGSANHDELARAIADRTWRYARRQRSWFRADPRCTVSAPEAVLSGWVAA
jgi:tRNA dimethylallyltransferase